MDFEMLIAEPERHLSGVFTTTEVRASAFQAKSFIEAFTVLGGLGRHKAKLPSPGIRWSYQSTGAWVGLRPARVRGAPEPWSPGCGNRTTGTWFLAPGTGEDCRCRCHHLRWVFRRDAAPAFC